MTAIARGAAIDVMAKAMTEGQLQDAVTGMLDAHRILWHHEVDSRKSKGGLPDLIIVGSRVEFWELKKQAENPTPAQRTWLTAIARAEGATGRVVRPMDLLRGDVQTWVRSLR